MKQDEKIARLRLLRSNNIGPVTSFLLISRYGSAIEAIRALPELTKRSRNRAKLAPLKSAEKEMRDVEDMGGQIIIRGEEGYPAAFAESIEANSVHGSDSPENAKIEIDFFFSADEITG